MVSFPKSRTIPDIPITFDRFGVKGISNQPTTIIHAEYSSVLEDIQISFLGRLLGEDVKVTKFSLETLEIRDLVKELSQIPGVESVAISYQIPGDRHAILFKIKVLTALDFDEETVEYESSVKESEKIWKTAQELVYQSCKYLRDKTSERWYFQTQLMCDHDD